MKYKEAFNIANNIKKYIKNLYIVGSLKRKSPIVNDIDFVTMNDLSIVSEKIQKLLSSKNLNSSVSGDKKYIKILIEPYNIYIDIWKANHKDELYSMIVMRTIDKGHSIYYKKLARSYDMILTDKGIKCDDMMIYFKSEKELKDILEHKLRTNICIKKI